MRNRYFILFLLILFLFGFCAWLIWPLDSTRLTRQGLRLGLDLKGGTHLVYEADLTKKDPSISDEDAMKSIRQTIERRINAYGVTEPNIQIQGTDRIIVQLPGVEDVNEAVRLIGKTAQLDFREQVAGPDEQVTWEIAKARGSDGQEKDLTGQYFKANAHIQMDNIQPVLAFEFDKEGAVLFKQITTRLVGKPLGIFLDGELISSPTVRAVIEDKGVIEGMSVQRAEILSIQLNSGALQAPLRIIQQRDVAPTLGTESLKKSLNAGIIGFILVLLFMILYYRVPGIAAAGALIIYGTMVLAIFKMVPVTLTLAGIAAFIISVGMAVDANVLIFERMKEELRSGKTLGASVEAGFNRAWSAIWTSNVSTVITCIILGWFGYRFVAGTVTGFALTLFIGVAVSMFSAVFITRNFLRIIIRTPLAKKMVFFNQ
ncbi:MAG: protein translocase subunit SecD [Dehalococcoidia bacterium]|nr:protein translocase subunit SecD [Dehalococcoidia bacterium]